MKKELTTNTTIENLKIFPDISDSLIESEQVAESQASNSEETSDPHNLKVDLENLDPRTKRVLKGLAKLYRKKSKADVKKQVKKKIKKERKKEQKREQKRKRKAFQKKANSVLDFFKDIGNAITKNLSKVIQGAVTLGISIGLKKCCDSFTKWLFRKGGVVKNE